jgi:hypothetical protein
MILNSIVNKENKMVVPFNAKKYFTTSMADFFRIGQGQEQQHFVTCLKRITSIQIGIIKPLGWYDESNSTYLEQVGMVMSEVYEVYAFSPNLGKETITEKSIEGIDILLRLFVLIDRMENQLEGSVVTFDDFIYSENPVDNRLEVLDTSLENFKLETWLFSIYNKLASSINLVRGKTLSEEQQYDLISCFNQVIYITILMVLQLNGIRPEDTDTDDLQLILDYFDTKLERNKSKLNGEYIKNNERYK